MMQSPRDMRVYILATEHDIAQALWHPLRTARERPGKFVDDLYERHPHRTALVLGVGAGVLYTPQKPRTSSYRRSAAAGAVK